MTDKRPLLILILVVALMFGGYQVTRTGASAANDSTDSTTTTSVTTSSTIPTSDGTPPGPAGGAVGWEEGLKRINDIENELFMKPDPSRVGEIMVAECDCYQQTVNALSALKAAGNRVAGANIVLNDTAFVSQDSETRVRVFTDPQPAGFPTVDAKGNTIKASPTGNRLPLLYILDKGSDGVWRLADRYIAGAEQ